MNKEQLFSQLIELELLQHELPNAFDWEASTAILRALKKELDRLYETEQKYNDLKFPEFSR